VAIWGLRVPDAAAVAGKLTKIKIVVRSMEELAVGIQKHRGENRMKSLAPLCNLLVTIVVSVWTVLIGDPALLALMLAAELVLLAQAGQLQKLSKALFSLMLVAAFFSVIQLPFDVCRSCCHCRRSENDGHDCVRFADAGDYPVAEPDGGVGQPGENSIRICFYVYFSPAIHAGFYCGKPCGPGGADLPRLCAEPQSFETHRGVCCIGGTHGAAGHHPLGHDGHESGTARVWQHPAHLYPADSVSGPGLSDAHISCSDYRCGDFIPVTQ